MAANTRPIQVDLKAMALPQRVNARRTFDMRTRAGRAVRQTLSSLIEAAGGREGLSGSDREQIERAAELLALAKQARAVALAGTPADLEMIVRLENAAQRALAGVKFTAKTKPLPDISAHVRALDRLAVQPELPLRADSAMCCAETLAAPQGDVRGCK